MDQLPKIFIAYAREDKPLLQKLRTHLNVMKRQQHCEIFYDGEIMPGETWDERLKAELHTAHIFVLLVTAEFLDSDYVNETELPKILDRRSKGEAEVIAVILKDCLWEYTELQHLQVVLKDEHPIEAVDGYAHAAREVFRVIAGRNEKLRKEVEPRAIDPFHELMIPIKGGIFQMGDEHGDLRKACRPVHSVSIKDFYLCKHPVTQAQWRAVMGSDPPKLGFKGCDDCPVESVSWDDVQEFLKKLNEKTGENYRLPTEAEWEYAARGGIASRKTKFAGSDNVDEVGWYQGNSSRKTYPVMQKKPNELGLYDLSGNVWEWCQDVWHDNYKDAPTDGSGWMIGGDQSLRVGRGGSWNRDAVNCRVANRDRDLQDIRSGLIGFRLAR
ncbi:MAG: SUMF1/EgtB/PvdO family nonheme iron enzyme [Saprospiraceae bacterium]|nr:SUMF1/EgtB/PvdO family nonheme iron enzyme [Saprospiraceae bacterium]